MEVSPIEPWIVPKKASIQVICSVTFVIPSTAAAPNGVAPLNPSTAVQTASPEICAG